MGDRIGDHYRVEAVLGEGGMGRVLRVFHDGWGIPLAMKCARRGVDDASLEREAEAWIELGLHPHIVSCHLAQRIGGRNRLILDLVDGGSLADWIADGRLHADGAQAATLRMLDVSIQFARGLAHAHSIGMVHQDVKPGNVMMSAAGVAKVTDFGLARIAERWDVSAGGTPNVSMSLKLTVPYCSPEQAGGARLTPATDVWSFGLSVLEMFVGGVHWYSGVAARAVLDALVSDPHGVPLPSDLVTCLEACFSHAPEARPSALALVSRLGGIYERIAGRAYDRPLPPDIALRAASDNNRGVSWLELGQPAKAFRCFERALENVPDHPEATFNRALQKWRAGAISASLVRGELATLASTRAARVRELAAWVALEESDADRLDELLRDTRGWEASVVSRLLALRGALGDGTRLRRVGLLSGASSIAVDSQRGTIRLARSQGVADHTWDLETLSTGAARVTRLLSPTVGIRVDRSGPAPSIVLVELDRNSGAARFEGTIGQAGSSLHPEWAASISRAGDWLAVVLTGRVAIVDLRARRSSFVDLGAKHAVTAWQPNGELLVVTDTGEAFCCDPHAQVTRPLALGAGPAHGLLDARSCAEVSSDGRWVALGGGKVELYDLERLGRVWTSNTAAHRVFFGPQYLAAAGSNALAIIELASGQILRAFECPPRGRMISFCDLCEGPSRPRQLGVLTTDDFAEVSVAPETLAAPWAIVQPSAMEELVAHQRRIDLALEAARAPVDACRWGDAVSALAAARTVHGASRHPSFQILAARAEAHCRRGPLLDLWSVGSIRVDDQSVGALALLSQGVLVAATNSMVRGVGGPRTFAGPIDGALAPIDLRDRQPGAPINAFAADAAGAVLIVGEARGGVGCFDVASGMRPRWYSPPTPTRRCVAGVAIDPAGRVVAAADFGGELTLFDARTGQARVVSLAAEGTWNVALDPLGRVALVFGEERHHADVVSVASGEHVGRIRERIYDASLDDLGAAAWVCLGDAIARIEPATGRVLSQVELGADSSHRMLWLRERGTLLVGGQDGCLRVVDERDGRVTHRLNGFGGAVSTFASTPDGRVVVAPGARGELMRWAFDWDVLRSAPLTDGASAVAARGGRAIWEAALEPASPAGPRPLAGGQASAGDHATRELVAKLNSVLVDILDTISAHGSPSGPSNLVASVSAWIDGSQLSSVLGRVINAPEPIDVGFVVRTGRPPVPAPDLHKSLRDLVEFALFVATTDLPRDVEVDLTRRVRAHLNAL